MSSVPVEVSSTQTSDNAEVGAKNTIFSPKANYFNNLVTKNRAHVVRHVTVSNSYNLLSSNGSFLHNIHCTLR